MDKKIITMDEVLSGYEIYFAGISNSNIPNKVFSKPINFIDVKQTKSRFFLDLLTQLDGLSYGNKSLAMDKWVSLDCGLIPSGFIGLAKKIENTSEKVLSKLDLNSNYDGLIPHTEFCAIPKMEQNHFIGHTCASIEPGKKLGLLSKLLGIRMLGIENYTGVAQYTNNAVKTHSQISDLELISAITPSHSEKSMTFIYTHPVSKCFDTEMYDTLPKIYETKPEIKTPDFYLNPHSIKEKISLQQKIETGNKFSIIYPGQIYDNDNLLIPIKQG
jgi:hypothetical protein